MSPAIKFEDQPAVSLLLPVDSKSLNVSPVNQDQDDSSRAAMMQMIYQLMLLIGENMSKIQQVNAESQIDQEKIAKHEAKEVKNNTQNYLEKLSQLEAKQEEAQKWQLFGTIMKWVGAAVGVLVGSLLIETGVGFAILLAAVALTTVPVSNGNTLFGMAADALATELQKTGLDATWAKIISQVILIVALTVVSCGAEGLSAGISKLASSAASVGSEVATEAAEEVSEEATEEVTEEVSSQVSKTSESKVSIRDFLPARSAATTQMFMQTLLSSGLTQELLSEIPGMDQHPVLEAIISTLINVMVMLASYKLAPAASGETLFGKLGSLLGNVNKLRLGIGTFVFATQGTTQLANGGQAYNTYEQGEITGELAPYQQKLTFDDGFMQIMTQLTSIAQKTYTESMNSDETVFKVDFSSDMSACIAAQQRN